MAPNHPIKSTFSAASGRVVSNNDSMPKGGDLLDMISAARVGPVRLRAVNFYSAGTRRFN